MKRHSFDVKMESDKNTDRAQAAHFFKEGALSLGQAAKFAGMPYVLFTEYLSREGIPVVDYPPEELGDELRVAASPNPLAP